MRFTSTISASKAKLILKSRIGTYKIDSEIEELKEVIKRAETKIKNEIETIKEAAKVPSKILRVTGMLIKTETKKRLTLGIE
jgi:hypothetical protein